VRNDGDSRFPVVPAGNVEFSEVSRLCQYSEGRTKQQPTYRQLSGHASFTNPPHPREGVIMSDGAAVRQQTHDAEAPAVAYVAWRREADHRIALVVAPLIGGERVKG
jgi:hypothetical protein